MQRCHQALAAQKTAPDSPGPAGRDISFVEEKKRYFLHFSCCFRELKTMEMLEPCLSLGDCEVRSWLCPRVACLPGTATPKPISPRPAPWDRSRCQWENRSRQDGPICLKHCHSEEPGRLPFFCCGRLLLALETFRILTVQSKAVLPQGLTLASHGGV